MNSLYKFLSLGLLILSIVTVIGCGKQTDSTSQANGEEMQIRGAARTGGSNWGG